MFHLLPIADFALECLPLVPSAAGIALIWFTRDRRQATTLVAPAGWTVFSLVAVAAVEAVLALADFPALADPLRFAAGTTTICPAVALLGAKRPQNRAWQFIVGSLWGIFLLTSLQSVVFYRGEELVVFVAWKYLLWILIAIGATNYIGTRFWLASVLVAVGQVALLRRFLIEGASWHSSWDPVVAVSLFTLAIGLATIEFPRRTQAASSLDRRWCDFRDAFGVVWALRIAQRVRSECRLESSQVHDAWRGISHLADEAENRHVSLAQIERTLAALLKRFVPADWSGEN